MQTPIQLRDAVLKDAGTLDREFYLKSYPDVARYGHDPVRHFLSFGWKEGRLPWSTETVKKEPAPPPTPPYIAPIAATRKRLAPLPKNPKIRAVIPTIWSKPELTLPLLLWLSSHGVHCTVIDNRKAGSDFVLPEGVHVIRDTEPFNFSRLCNLGFRTAVPKRSKNPGIILFINDDQRVIDEEWLTHLIKAFEDDTVACAGPVTVNPNGSVQGMGAVCRLEGSGVIGLHSLEGRHTINNTVECESIGGSCMAFRVEAFPGFDEGYRITHSDNVICLDVRDAGYRVVTALNSRIEHHEKSSRAPLGDPVEDIQRFWATRWENIMQSAPRAKCSVYQRDLVRVEDVHEIIAIKLDHIGDIFMARDALSMLGAKFPTATITVICASFAVDIFHKWGYKTIVCDFWSEGGVAAQQHGLSPEDRAMLKGLHADLAADLRVGREAREVLSLINAKWKIAYGEPCGGLLGNQPAHGELPMLQKSMSHKKQLEVMVERIDVWSMGTIINRDGIIGLNRHASARGKLWPLWDQLVAWLSGHGIPFKEYGPGMCAMEDFADLVASECRVYIGHDTGPTHAVAATGLPVVEIIGGIVPVHEWLATGNVVGLGVEQRCSPCYKPAGCPGMACMGVAVMDVVWGVGEVLRQ
jgi:hypothetical protein